MEGGGGGEEESQRTLGRQQVRLMMFGENGGD